MKKDLIIFWLTTGLVSLMMLFIGFNYLTNDAMKANVAHLGYPWYFVIELGVAKILGSLVLLIPAVPAKLKEFAYVGFIITFISAFIAHLSVGDGIGKAIIPLIVLGILLISHFYYYKLNILKAITEK